MTAKTDDEIAREKEAVQKMIGAKSAMETALQRIRRLEDTLGHIDAILADMRGKVGEGLYVKTFYHGASGSGEATVTLKSQIDYAKRMIGAVK